MAVLFSALDVMSASGLLCRFSGSGDSGGSSVAVGGNDGTADDRLLREGAALFRFLGDAFLDGDAGSLGAMLSSGSNICVGSMPSPVLVRLDRADFLGEGSMFAVVCRRVDLRGLRFGAGVNSSS
jgi:hypothetical protein